VSKHLSIGWTLAVQAALRADIGSGGGAPTAFPQMHGSYRQPQKALVGEHFNGLRVR
jgi:hypothetical protein